MENKVTTPEVCVVTPVKNGGKYLSAAIESVLSQTLQNWEYVIVDGGSEDNSVSIARSYEKNDRRITVISCTDKGMYDAIFKGFERTTATICCWINSDDKFMPWAFEIVAEYMKRTGADWVTGIPGNWDERGLLRTVRFPLLYPRILIRLGLAHGKCLGFIQQESTFFTRRLLNRIDANDVDMIRSQKYAGDFLLWTRFARYSSLYTFPTVLGGFRKHGGNLSRNTNAYFEEISKLGYYVPSLQVLGRFMRLLMWPFAFLKFKSVCKNWCEDINKELNKDMEEEV